MQAAKLPSDHAYRVNVLKAMPGGRAMLVHTWLTDAEGASVALDEPREDGLAVHVELEGWTAPFPRPPVPEFN